MQTRKCHADADADADANANRICTKINLSPVPSVGDIIIIILFQEDNIFGTSASLTYGPQLQLQIASFVIDEKIRVYIVALKYMQESL